MTTTLAPTVHPGAQDAAPHPGTGPRRAARVAGLGYVLIFALAILANFVVVEGLVVQDDAQATAANIRGDLALFRLGLVAFLVVFLLDIVIAWALHVVFRAVHPDLSLLAAWARLVYTAFLGVGLVFYAEALGLLEAETSPTTDVAEQALAALGSFETTWLIGLSAFGVHLVLLAVLAVRSGVVPRPMALLLAVAGAAYAVDTVAHLALPDYEQVAGIMLALVALPSMLGEGWLALWLLRSRRLPR